MKTFLSYWNGLCVKNPMLVDSDKMTLSVEAFQKQLEQAWNDGRRSAVSRKDAADAFKSLGRSAKPADDILDTFKNMLGR